MSLYGSGVTCQPLEFSGARVRDYARAWKASPALLGADALIALSFPEPLALDPWEPSGPDALYALERF